MGQEVIPKLRGSDSTVVSHPILQLQSPTPYNPDLRSATRNPKSVRHLITGCETLTRLANTHPAVPPEEDIKINAA